MSNVQNKYSNDDLENMTKSIYQSYLDIIAPFIIQLEILDNEFPIEIMNEIRAIFTHLARANVSNKSDVKEDNIIKAERHVKRAILDCFKYSCISYDDKYYEFEALYNNVDLSNVSDGEFIVELSKKRVKAMSDMQKAKSIELTTENIDDSFFAFETAYNSYADVYNYINETQEKLIRVKQKSEKKQRWHRFLDYWSIIGTIFGIIGVILTIMSL